MKKGDFTWNGYKGTLTCQCFPEQYDITHRNKIVGYFRVRHGMFWAFCPDAGVDSECVYSAEVGYGEFCSDEERELHINLAMAKVREWNRRKAK